MTKPRMTAGIASLYLVDDAHLMPEALLRGSEEQTSSSALLLSAHTVSDSAEHIRGAVALDAERAVEAIANSLRSTRIDETYELVRAIDNAIGDHAGDERIEARIDLASDKAGYPWQFCFILGGGWRRARGETISQFRIFSAGEMMLSRPQLPRNALLVTYVFKW